MKNTLADLNDHLFAQMERLGDENLEGEDLINECQRSEHLTKVATKIVDNANLMLQAVKVRSELAPSNNSMPNILTGEKPKGIGNDKG